jgi:hypothetical protein
VSGIGPHGIVPAMRRPALALFDYLAEVQDATGTPSTVDRTRRLTGSALAPGHLRTFRASVSSRARPIRPTPAPVSVCQRKVVRPRCLAERARAFPQVS